MPQLDPAGNTLLYVRRVDGRYGLWRRRLDGSPPLPVAPAADSDDLYPAWDGEGRRIAFLRYAAGGCRVMLLDDVDAAPREVGGCFADFAAPLAFGADGASLLLTDRVASAQPTLHLVRLDLADGRLSLLDYARDPQRTDSDARLAPDGQRIAFRRGGAGVVELHVHDGDRGSSRRLAALAGGVGGFDWLPDGSGLLLSALDANRPTLSLLRMDGAITAVAEGRYGRLQRARDSDRWAAVSGSMRSGLWQLDAHGAGTPLLAVGVGQDRHPLALDDGGLLFVSDRSGQPELWEIAAGASAPQQLSRRRGGALGAPLWRGGDEVWAPSLQQGRWQLWRWRRGEAAGSLLEAPGHDLLELADDGQRLWAIAARDDQAGSSELVELQVKEDRLALRRTGVEAIAVRAGDGRLYVRQHLRRGIRAVDPQTLALAEPVGDRHFIDWRLDGDAALHWVADDALRHSLWRTPLGGGQPQRLLAGRDDIAVGAGFTRLADGSLVTVRIDLDDLDIVGFRLSREHAAAVPPP
jgi:dipeptidyl aminopeptidase/acylaminoacyl peptidase